MTFSEFLKKNTVFLDGGLGTMLQSRGLPTGELPERWGATHPEVLVDIHRQYYDAGSNLVAANTFGANCLKFDAEELEAIVKAALDNVRAAAAQSTSTAPKFAALDIGPTGRLLRPLGDMDFEDAVAVFAETVKLGVKYGADAIFIETMNDSYETKAAVLAAKENSDLPILVSNAYGEDGKLMTGATPSAMVAMLEGLGVTALGANCSLGPRQLRSVVQELLEAASVPVILKPNAGLPRIEDGCTVFDVTVDEFAAEVKSLAAEGVRLVGGCCGTTPTYIAALHEALRDQQPLPLTDKGRTVVSSYTHTVEFGDAPILIGERINPTGKKRFKQALAERDMGYLLNEGIKQQEAGVHVLDVNVGLPEIDEVAMLRDAVCELQAVTDLPLQIDTVNVTAMEAALRRVNGKAMVNSVSGKAESMAAIFPLVKKYGGVVVALTLDEDGIPTTAEGRVAIARRILDTAAQYGIDKKEIIFDTLAMTVSADPTAASVTLEALRRIRAELGCHTSLGVSNVSFGLPNRDAVNGTFFAMALANGLSAAIMNPYSADMRKAYYAYRALRGLDVNCADYIREAASFTSTAAPVAVTAAEPTQMRTELQYAIIKGLQEQAGALPKALLEHTEPLVIVNGEIIPALNEVGEGYEKKTVFLPQLLMSAEAAKSAFESIKAHMAHSGGERADRGVIVLATVRGDIHDIGKNIVKLLLENYGYEVIDLGRDVTPQAVLAAVRERRAPLVGLSALMTTTVPAMEETVKLLHAEAPWCKVMVGGAVLTQAYADQIGADKYGRDAMEAVRYAEDVIQ